MNAPQNGTVGRPHESARSDARSRRAAESGGAGRRDTATSRGAGRGTGAASGMNEGRALDGVLLRPGIGGRGGAGFCCR